MSRYREFLAACPRLMIFFLCCRVLLTAQTPVPPDDAPITDRERALMDRIARLEQRMAMLESKLNVASTPQPFESSAPVSASTGVATVTPTTTAQTAAQTNAPIPGFPPGTTMNLYFDGHYGWNFNQPVGRVNLLRANDVMSNNFTLNQVGLIVERAPDVAAGRRFGARVDLMFGLNTETLQGGTQNEPRPQVYRNIFQAYGTYVFPAGSGLIGVDFGKFYSALGFENNYAYHEINYSRSFYFNYLPFYHMGFRTTYNINDKLAVQHWLVNGANQTEDFNGQKSNAFLFTIKPVKTISWNVNYYFGQENRDLTPAYNPGIPAIPTHIFDTYASWSPTVKVTVAGEFDHVVSRLVTNGPPSGITGGVGYLQYHLSPKLTFAGRFEYLQDHGGLFSGLTQDLKEHTLTATYQFADGFQTRMEYRRDFSNQPFFPTGKPGFLKKEQNTATLGLIWWFGGKSESW